MSRNDKDSVPGKWYLQKVKLNAQGYARGGHYYGIGAALYRATRASDDKVIMIRARTRRLAAAELRDQFPKAVFFVTPMNRLTQTQGGEHGK